MNVSEPTQLETRISAYLDGELSGDQQAELFRDLLRDPAKRRQMDRAAETDRLAGQALRSALMAPPRAPAIDQLPRRGPHAWRWAQALATAAMIVLAVGLYLVVFDGNDADPADRSSVVSDDAAQPPAIPQPDDPALAEGDAQNDAAQPTLEELLAAAPSDEVEPWWRNNRAPMEGGRLVDRAAELPLVPGPQIRRLVRDRSMVSVIDTQKNVVYLLEAAQTSTRSTAMAGEL